MSGPDAPPGPRGSFSEEALTAKRTNQVSELASQMNAPDAVSGDAPKPPSPALLGLTPPPLPQASGFGPSPLSPPPPLTAPAPAVPAPPALVGPGSAPGSAASPPAAPPLPVRAGPPAPPPRGPAALPPPPQRSGASASPPVVGPPPRGKPAGPSGSPGPTSAPERSAADKLFGGDEVDSLLSTFEVSNVGEKQVRNDLKAIAGVEPTPGPPDAVTLAELTKDVGKGLPKRDRLDSVGDTDSVEALLALSDTGGPSPKEEAPLLPPASVAHPGHALSPPSPLVPMMPQPATTAGNRPSPPPPMPVAATAAMEAALKRPATPRAAGRPVPPVGAPPPAASASGRREKLGDPGTAPNPAAQSTRRRNTTSANFRQPRAPRTGLAMLILTLVVLVAGGIAVWMFKPAFFTGKKKPVPTASVSVAPAVPVAPRCKVALVVSDVPANAEILLRMGQAPLDVERMPVGTRLEFVATAEGYAPRRAVIKAESPWDKAPDGKPRIDVPIQLDPTKAKAGTVDPWPAAEPGSQVGGSGSPGTVHVVSNVRGAEVWLLAGLGPEARIEQLRCDGDIDVLLAGPPQLRKRLHIGEKEIQAATPDPQGNRVVSVTAK
jgi:hypothetical protein